MTNRKLQALAKKWIHRLELGPPAWNQIEVRFGTRDELRGALGACGWMIDYSTAQVIVGNEDLHSEDGDHSTVEETLVHELLHLRLEGHLPGAKPSNAHFERAINIIAGLLCRKKPS